MNNFEKELQETLQETQAVSKEARQAFDMAYQKISQEKKRVKPKKKRIFPLVIVAAILLLGFSLAFTPIGKAVTNFLRLDQFTSKSLRNDGFITKQSTKAVNEEIEIKLNEVYADQNEIGLHFTIQFPKQSKFTDKTLEYYGINFALKNGDGRYLVDFKSGLSEVQENLNLFSSIVPDSHFDHSTNQLELTYRLKASAGDVPPLENAVVVITRLTAMYPIDDTPGFHEGKEGETFEKLEGLWELPIDTSKIKSFDALEFTPTDPARSETVSGLVYPNSFVLTTSDDKFTAMIDPDDIWLQAVINGQEERYLAREFSSVEEDGKEYYQIIFDYPGYDQADLLTFHFGDTEIEFKRQ
ncbi:DUF4179 domain-containing protein [Enterococcus termitis]|uniref:DUF4179 domain-containing protein n=1 Tax=Enterococcus termitis TaxID=332950 RepID=A0A1E5GY37_9ENTE|nr:DUF4179 domain-containing protein [Enterococcus termitis]OEG17644.1 hypothetical protein BCR25_18205 [Enterococcus termitis]OJG96392.1 hypothetical protein RV18_GL002571 [Enterococcus termitis]